MLIIHDFFNRASEKTQQATRPRWSGWVSLFDDGWDIAVESLAKKIGIHCTPGQGRF